MKPDLEPRQMTDRDLLVEALEILRRLEQLVQKVAKNPVVKRFL